MVKGGLKMLTKNIASEYGQYNIQCNGLGPDYIATPRQRPCVNGSQMAAVTPLMNSSQHVPRPDVGGKRKI